MKKVLMVGFGSIGKRHVINLLTHSNVKIIVLTKRKNIKLEKIGKQKKISLLKSDKFGIAPNEIEIPHGKYLKFFNSLDQCLAEKPDIGFITNETRYHIPITLKLAKFGLDLFIEKPLSDSMKDIKKLKKINKERFRLTVFRSSKNISAQIIDDKNNKTLVSASSIKEKKSSKKK